MRGIRALTLKMAESVDIDLYENIEEGFDQVQRFVAMVLVTEDDLELRQLSKDDNRRAWLYCLRWQSCAKFRVVSKTFCKLQPLMAHYVPRFDTSFIIKINSVCISEAPYYLRLKEKDRNQLSFPQNCRCRCMKHLETRIYLHLTMAVLIPGSLCSLTNPCCIRQRFLSLGSHIPFQRQQNLRA